MSHLDTKFLPLKDSYTALMQKLIETQTLVPVWVEWKGTLIFRFVYDPGKKQNDSTDQVSTESYGRGITRFYYKAD